MKKRKPCSEETKRKISLANTGKKRTLEFGRRISILNKGRKPWNTGKKRPDMTGDKNPAKRQEVRDKISKNSIGRPKLKIRGKNHWNWKGGKSLYGLELNDDLKEVIRNRDKRKCQICDKIELDNKERLTVHHIDFDKMNNDTDNLVSLCRSCHMTLHRNTCLDNLEPLKKLMK